MQAFRFISADSTPLTASLRSMTGMKCILIVSRLRSITFYFSTFSYAFHASHVSHALKLSRTTISSAGTPAAYIAIL